MSGTLFVGLGNMILCDDSIGIRIVEALKRDIPGLKSRIVEICNLDLIYEIEGEPSVCFIDSMLTGKYPPGHILEMDRSRIGEFRSNPSRYHGLNLFDLLDLGRKYGIGIADDIRFFGIEVIDNVTFSEELTPGMQSLFPGIVGRMRELTFCTN